MRIQYFNGGLANQVFQYIFYRYAQLSMPGQDVWFLDDSFFFFKQEHNGYELEKVFGLRPNLLSSQFEPQAWDFFIENRKKGIGTAQTMLQLGLPIEMVAEAANYKNDNPFYGKVYTLPCNEYHPEVLRVPGPNLYYFGYWINKNWFYTYKDLFLEELSFPPIPDEKNLSYATKIKSTYSVAVHVRRGDFVRLGWEMPQSIYMAYSQKMIHLHPDATYFVFSDDIAWCREQADELGLSLAKDVVFVEGNENGANYIDMQLMSMCRGIILSNSSFCYLAALLDKNLDCYISPVETRQL